MHHHLNDIFNEILSDSPRAKIVVFRFHIMAQEDFKTQALLVFSFSDFASFFPLSRDLDSIYSNDLASGVQVLTAKLQTGNSNVAKLMIFELNLNLKRFALIKCRV